MSLVLARERFFHCCGAGGDVSESHNGCRSRSWRLRRHIKTSVRQRQRQRRVSTKGFVIIIISHINSPRLINDLRRGCLKTKRVHAAAAAAGNDGLVWFVIYYFVEALRKTVTRGERERERRRTGGVIYFPPLPGADAVVSLFCTKHPPNPPQRPVRAEDLRPPTRPRPACARRSAAPVKQEKPLPQNVTTALLTNNSSVSASELQYLFSF